MALSFAGGCCGWGGLVRRERFVSWRGVQLSSGWTNSRPAAIFFGGGEGSLPSSHGYLSCSRGPAPDPTTVSFHLEPHIISWVLFPSIYFGAFEPCRCGLYRRTSRIHNIYIRNRHFPPCYKHALPLDSFSSFPKGSLPTALSCSQWDLHGGPQFLQIGEGEDRLLRWLAPPSLPRILLWDTLSSSTVTGPQLVRSEGCSKRSHRKWRPLALVHIPLRN